MSTGRLITIPISHYCERARWALDRAGVVYREEQHLQMFAARQAKAAGGTHTVPVYVTNEGEVLADSADIVDYASRRAPASRKLFPEDEAQRQEVETLARQFAGTFGVDTRRYFYRDFFRWGRGALKWNAGDAPRWQHRALWLAYPVAAPLASRYVGSADDVAVEAGRERFEQVLDEVAQRLAKNGTGYLVGDSFTAADLTFACMAAPLVVPEHYGVKLPELVELPDRVRSWVNTYRAHEAGQHARRMFERHRRETS